MKNEIVTVIFPENKLQSSGIVELFDQLSDCIVWVSFFE